MNETRVKTRHGLILEGIFESGLIEAGFQCFRGYQYSPDCEIPDFLIPNCSEPEIMIEVHQTDYENSFMMKILRAFMAVAEAKSYYGPAMASLNVLMGDPDADLPQSSVNALFSFFDQNWILIRAAKIHDLEMASLAFASDEDMSVVASVRDIISQNKDSYANLVRFLRMNLSQVITKPELKSLWTAISLNINNNKEPPLSGVATYYRRSLYSLLLLNKECVTDLLITKDAQLLCQDSINELRAHKLVTVEEDILGDIYLLSKEILFAINTPEVETLYHVCWDAAERIQDFSWFAEDIRDETRRLKMAEIAIDLIDSDRIEEGILANFEDDSAFGIQHSRSWIVDLLVLWIGTSQNDFSREIVREGKNLGSFRRPLSHITPKTERFRSLDVNARIAYAYDVEKAFTNIRNRLALKGQNISTYELSKQLFDFRLANSIKLQKLDLFESILQHYTESLGLIFKSVGVESVIGDLLSKPSVAKFEAFEISDAAGRKILANCVAVHDGHGDDKSKEWGARRLATLYRIKENKIVKSEYQDAIFVIDGEWTDKDVARLYRSGWNRVVRFGQLENTLREAFKIKRVPKAYKKPIIIAEELLAAEDWTVLKG